MKEGGPKMTVRPQLGTSRPFIQRLYFTSRYFQNIKKKKRKEKKSRGMCRHISDVYDSILYTHFPNSLFLMNPKKKIQ